MRALGLDFGQKSLGIAISDEHKIVASPLENFFHNNNLNDCINHLKMIFNKYHQQIDCIIVGYATYLSNDKSMQTLLTNHFINMLKSNFPNIGIIKQDEYLSTKQAVELLINNGCKKNRIKKMKDKMSAVIILERWLNNNAF